MRAVPSRCQPALAHQPVDCRRAWAPASRSDSCARATWKSSSRREFSRHRVGDLAAPASPDASTSAASSSTRLSLVGQVLAEDAPVQRRGPGARARAGGARGPRPALPARLGSAALIGPPVGREAPLGAAHEAALLVGLVELKRLDASSRTGPASSRGPRRRGPPTLANGCIISRRPTRPLRVGQAVGVRGARREQQQPRRADGVRGQHDDLGRLEVLARRRGRSTSRR